jgi:hypothetical protein
MARNVSGSSPGSLLCEPARRDLVHIIPMTRPQRVAFPLVLLGALLIAGVAGIAMDVRLDGTGPSTGLPAEEPYIHMAAIRENLQSGSIGPMAGQDPTGPPGTQALLSAVWVYTGADLQELVRHAPVLLGVIGLLGAALLLWRHAGMIAAIIGTLAYAVAPELIFRTTMMSEPAILLAIAPYILYLMIETIQGATRWAFALFPALLFVALTVPIALLLFLVPVIVFTGALLIIRPKEEAPVSLSGLLLIPALLGATTALGLILAATTWGPLTTAGIPPTLFAFLATAAVLIAIVPALLLLRSSIHTKWKKWTHLKNHRKPSKPVAAVISITALATLIVGSLWPALGTPLPDRFGWPLVALAAIGFILLPAIPSRLGLLVAPLFIINHFLLLTSPGPGWAEVTAVITGLSLVVTAGTAVAGIARFTIQIVSASDATPISGVALPLAILAVALGSTVYAGAEDAWDWHRLFDECEIEALEEIAAIHDAQPQSQLFTGSWQSWLVLRAHTQDNQGIHIVSYGNEGPQQANDKTFILVEPYAREQTSPQELAFLQEDGWEPRLERCSDDGTPRIQLYETNPT